MESLLFPRLIFIFVFVFFMTFFSIVCNPVHGFDIYLSPDSSPTPQQSGSSPDKPRNSGIYVSYPPKSSLNGGADNQQSLHSISSGVSNNNDDEFSETRISKSAIHSVLKAKKTAASATAAGSVTAKSQLKKICGKTEKPALCISTVEPRLRGGGVHVRAVLDVAIKASYELAKVGTAKAKKLAMSSPESPDIDDCKGSFDDALSNFDQALKAFHKKDVGTMNSMLAAVVTDMSDCNDSLSGGGSPLMTIGDKLANMTSICLGIISQMQ